MKSTITIEIEIPVTFSASKGYPATHEDPGCPDEINDLDYDETEALKLIETALSDPEIEGVLLDEANQAAIEYKYEEAEYRYEQKKDAEIERHWNKGE